MLGSGPMGEFLAIDRMEVAAGSLIMLASIYLLWTMLESRRTRPNFKRAGRLMVAMSLTATCIYVVGLFGEAEGWLIPSLFPDRFRQNLLGSLLFAALGAAVPQLPRFLPRIDRRRDPSG